MITSERQSLPIGLVSVRLFDPALRTPLGMAQDLMSQRPPSWLPRIISFPTFGGTVLPWKFGPAATISVVVVPLFKETPPSPSPCPSLTWSSSAAVPEVYEMPVIV